MYHDSSKRRYKAHISIVSKTIREYKYLEFENMPQMRLFFTISQ